MSTYSDLILADSPLCYYRLGESSGTTMADSSENGRDGSYSGTFALGANALITDSDTALSFVSPGGMGSVPLASWMDTGTVSVEAWVLPAGAGFDGNGGGAVVARDSTSDSYGNRNWYLYRNDTGSFAWRGFGGGSQRFNLTSSVVESSDPVHIVGTWDGSSAVLYVNASVAASASGSGLLSSSRNLTIGRAEKQIADGLHYFNGTIDEVALYATALTESQVAAHYSEGSGPKILPGVWGWI